MRGLVGMKEHLTLRQVINGDLRIAAFGLTSSNLKRFRFIEGKNIVVSFDNKVSDVTRCGVLGERVLSPERLRELNDGSCFDVLLIMSGSVVEIGRQLDDLGVVGYYWVHLLNENIPFEDQKKAYCEREMISEEAEKIDKTCALLADDFSVDVIRNVLHARKSQNVWERFQYMREVYSEEEYFPNDIPCFGISSDEVFVDAGAYVGDTISNFLDKVNHHYKHIYAFEPDEKSFAELQDLYSHNPQVSLYKKGLYSRNGRLEFVSCENKLGSHLKRPSDCDEQKRVGGVLESQITDVKTLYEIEVCCLDNVVDEPVSFIKMDIEGAELCALEGARKTIQRYSPKLAICLYHNINDCWELPLYIHQIAPHYQLYARQHSVGIECWDTVLYAIPCEDTRNGMVI